MVKIPCSAKPAGTGISVTVQKTSCDLIKSHLTAIDEEARGPGCGGRPLDRRWAWLSSAPRTQPGFCGRKKVIYQRTPWAWNLLKPEDFLLSDIKEVPDHK